MPHFDRQYSSASPVLTIQPQSYFQTQLSAGTFGRQNMAHMSFNTSPAPTVPAKPARSAGRKRSRDEASINLEPDSQPPVPVESKEDWIYGEGMVLIKPNKGYVADASSQSGTWLEEKMEEEQKAKLQAQASQLETRNCKAQRLDYSSSQTSFCNTVDYSPSNHSDNSSSGPFRQGTLVIDDFTIHLGIGWRKISEEEHIQAAARGWARFIENNFSLSNARICLESKGLQSYLVEASEGYFLFAENLRHGRLVSQTAEGALQNLQLSPPNFEGPELDMQTIVNRQNQTSTDCAMAID